MPRFIEFFVILCRLLVPGSLETCYFPDYLQGDYFVQSGVGLQSSSSPRIQYKTVTIASEAISPWGFCYKKIANDMYLTQSIDDKSVCLRCFHVSIKSQNVIIVRTSGNPDRCSVTEESAKANCPKTEFIDTGRQMILYKSAKDIKKEQCPINGVYTVQYSRQHKLDKPLECVGLTSRVDNCPVGSEFNIRFKNCPFENHDIVFECLGTWNGPNDQKYLALFDTRPTIDDGKLYRCGLYSEDAKSGTINVAFSSDSTCLNDLKTSQSGFEQLVLVPQPSNSQSQQTTERAGCRFPNWIQGHWELVTVDGKTFNYIDIVHYKSYTFQCLNYDETEIRYDFPLSIDEEKKILLHGRTHCGEELYSCVWLKRRGPNVFEFQFSTPTSPHYNRSLCSSVNFQSNVWITQGRKDYLEESPCPILGKYIGTLPDTADRLCAKLSSDCSMPDTMYYTVSDCSTQIYEEKRRRRVRQVSVQTNTQIENTTVVTNVPVNATRSTTVESIEIATTTESTSSSATNNVSTVVRSRYDNATNDSIAEETNRQAEAETNSPESSSVGSYFVENRNLPGVWFRDVRLDSISNTYFPSPISSSTMPPPIFRRTFPTPPSSRQYQTEYRNPAYRAGYYQSQEQLRNMYYHEWNRTAPESDYRTVNGGGGGGGVVGGGKTIIALPPVQLHHSAFVNRNSPYKTYKDREYQCLGQWQENGLTYTFTQRKHVGTYECFVGSMISETEFSIREAGRHCERNGDNMLGMILKKTQSCTVNRTSSTRTPFVPTTVTTSPPVAVTVTTTKSTPPRRVSPVTRPFRPLLNVTRPQFPYRSKTSTTNASTKIVPTQLFVIFVTFVYRFY